MTPMPPAAPVRFRDAFRKILPWWLRERVGKTVGFRLVWSLVAPLDVLMEWTLQGMRASWPGAGTPSALPLIGRSRGVVRGQSDTIDDFAARLRRWLDDAVDLGSELAVARVMHEFLLGRPRVRVITRAGLWTTIDTNGTVTQTTHAWDWDSVSNPERAGFWSEFWIVVYTSEWAPSGTWGDGRTYGGRNSGLGHQVTRAERDAVLALISATKGAHTFCRAVIWTTDATLFDPTNPASLPDGTWGQWSLPGSDPRAPGGRNRTTCRYWEPA